MSKVIVFDVDGTLFDTKSGIVKALNEVLNNFGKSSINPADEDKWIGPPVRNSFVSFSNMDEEQAEEATKQYRQIYTEKYISESVLYEGMSEVLNTLRVGKCHLCIATMKTREQVKRLLSLKNMTDDFEIIEAASSDGSKSKSDMLTNLKTKYPNENQFYMIGDTIGDYVAASIANYKFIGVKYGYGNEIDENKLFNIQNPIDLLREVK